MKIESKKDPKFENLGTLNDFISKYGVCSMTIDDINEPNIPLSIISNQEIEFKLYCSYALSDIIRHQQGFPYGMKNYRILRITNNDGSSYIRVSQSADIKGDPTMSIHECLEEAKKMEGRNIGIVFNIDDIKPEPYKPKNIPPTDLSDLIAL